MSDSNALDYNGSNDAASKAFAKAVSLHLDGKFAEALAEITRVLDLGNATPQLYSAKAHIEFEMQQYGDAARDYQKVLSLDPDFAGAQLHLAFALEKNGQWEEAADAFRKALTVEPERPDAMLGLAVCTLHLERPEEALKSIDKVLEIDPGNATALFSKAVALQLLWKFDEATELYQKILK